MRDAGAPVRPHDDEIAAEVARGLENFQKRVAVAHVHVHLRDVGEVLTREPRRVLVGDGADLADALGAEGDVAVCLSSSGEVSTTVTTSIAAWRSLAIRAATWPAAAAPGEQSVGTRMR